MERAELNRMEKQFAGVVRKHLPGAPVRRVALLQYGDDPAIEPGGLLAQVFIEAAGNPDERIRILHEFEHDHQAGLRELRRDLGLIPGTGALEIIARGDDPEDDGPRFRMGPPMLEELPEAGPLAAVMARLGPADLETVDVLITAGIASSRAEAVRWALARIRERPAYGRLRERAREIEELKAQF